MEVLPREEYEEEHLPGAINIPLKELDRETTTRLRRDAPVIEVEDALDRVRAAGWDRCVVVSRERVVLGLLRDMELSSDPEASVGEMSGPTTLRPNVPAGELAKRMRGMPTRLVTTTDARLVGLLCREEAERLAGQRP